VTNDQRTRHLDRALRADVADAVDSARRWLLPPSQWAGVGAAVADLAAAVRAGDEEAVRSRVDQLELCGPVRARGMEEEPVVPAPPALHPVLNAMMHEIDEEPPAFCDED
jgi:hypothetical protein